ncbi:YeeE/YedE thiosulfate transporter family protein [Methylomonas sp. AM2-LC]|uniref:YeeE/YedE family protein n=1 Tax=Methylomonas sp. AM2-LC TaxID=3153301 RepID=UPI0032633850
MAEITVLSALAGGSLIGLASALLFIKFKRVAGISGIAAGILRPRDSETGWRLWFLLGLLLSAPLYRLLELEIPIHIQTPLLVLAISGLLVGYGTRLGGGCTSGHGVCGIARLSVRSMVATLVFMLTAGISVFIVRHIL